VKGLRGNDRILYGERLKMMTTKRPNILIALALLCAAALWVERASGAPQEEASRMSEARQFHIQSQAMSAALKEFADQAGVQIMFPPELVAGRISPVVQGEKSAAEALRQLLEGSGLEFAVQGNTVAVRSPGSPTADLGKSGQAEMRVAQAEAADSANPGKEGQQSTPSESKDAEDGEELDEILVTAQKRQERLQEVPISISVLRGDDLDKSTVQGITEALNRVSGVATNLTMQGGGTQIAVRGVTAGGSLFNGSSPIAYYLDSAPFGLIKTAIVPDANAYDLERVEVLRGPQGTLYGATALNGVVRVLTKNADPDNFEIKARTTGSTTKDGGENYRGDLAVNMPLVEGKVALRGVVGYEDWSGWIDKPNDEDANDGVIRNMRLKVHVRPLEKLSLDASAWLSRGDFGAPSVALDSGASPTSLKESMSQDYDVYNVGIGYDFSAFSVASATSYLKYDNGGDLDLSELFGASVPPLFTGLDSKVFSQELTVNSAQAGPWRWSVGGIYRDAEDQLLQTLGSLLPVPIDFSDLSESFAVFGQVTRLFLNGRLELTGGLRYFEDDVIQIENQPSSGNPADPVLPPDGSTFDATSPRIVLTWHPSDAATVYGSYSEGFRSGFNQNANVKRAAPQFAPLEADTLKNYEIGAKGNLWSRRVAYETAVYYVDWQDVQQTVAVIANGVPVTALINGPSASGMGLEFAVTGEPVDGLDLGVNFSWNDLAMDARVESLGSTGPVVLFDKGNRLNASAEHTVGTFMDYNFPLGGGGLRGQFSASANYISEQATRAIIADDVSVVDGDETLIARAAFSIDSSERWTATLFAENLTNEQDASVRDAIVEGWARRARPRTVGVQFEYRFGAR
jgi:iron complex outermembrane recepter protein